MRTLRTIMVFDPNIFDTIIRIYINIKMGSRLWMQIASTNLDGDIIKEVNEGLTYIGYPPLTDEEIMYHFLTRDEK